MHRNGLDSIKLYQKSDLILILLAIVLFILSFIFIKTQKENGGKLLVRVDGKTVESYNLSRDISKTLQFDDGVNIWEIKDGKVSMISADCRDQICVHHVPISGIGETIVCLPHKVILEIVQN